MRLDRVGSPGARGIAGAGAALVVLPMLPAGSGMVELHMLDVGQGDAIALRTPQTAIRSSFDAGRAWRGGDAGRSTITSVPRTGGR